MAIHRLFPTLVYTKRLGPSAASLRKLNRALRSDAEKVRDQDDEGRRWSENHYFGGYTSYGSFDELHRVSSTFGELEKRLDKHVCRYARFLGLKLEGRSLAMTSCWINWMDRGCAHSLHLHPLSVVSGTYYLEAPPGAGDFKLEDPRLSKLMHAPTREGIFARFEPKTGYVILFESWLRHEVEANRSRQARISISFNYDWA